MLSIGDFSKICATTTKTLRYYDEIGLIKPALINPENGYRYYDVKQLRDLLKINRLKFYGFSLDEIAEIVKGGANDDLLTEKLYSKEKEMEQSIEKADYALRQLKKDIGRINKGEDIMSYLDNIEVKLIETEPMNILSSRQMMSMQDFGLYYGKIFEQVVREKLTVTGMPLAIYHDREFNPSHTDVETGVPVAEAVKGTRDLAGGLCATIRLVGPYSELPSCYAKLKDFAESEGYDIVSAPYEIYVTDMCDEKIKPENYITDIFMPIKKK